MRPYEDSSWNGGMRLSDRVRHNMRSGVLRLRGAWLQIVQTAVAAGIA